MTENTCMTRHGSACSEGIEAEIQCIVVSRSGLHTSPSFEQNSDLSESVMVGLWSIKPRNQKWHSN